uniref:Uncharacterized protein n=1 Tax=Oryza brachyantha TaxID=4533 RepID=J3KYL3_ORYBR
MASIVLLLSELLGGESTSVMAADWYMRGHSLREFRPVAVAAKAGERPAAETRRGEAEERGGARRRSRRRASPRRSRSRISAPCPGSPWMSCGLKSAGRPFAGERGKKNLFLRSSLRVLTERGICVVSPVLFKSDM